MLPLTLLPILLAATQVSAFQCSHHTFTQCADNIVHWYDPDDGMICDPLDCGGGRAPPKTDEPCCGNYKGTAACVTSASYLSCFKQIAKSTLMESTAQPTPTADATTTAAETMVSPTEAASSENQQPVSTGSASESMSISASTTQPPATGASTSVGPSGNATSAVPSGSGANSTLSGTPEPSQFGNSASGVRYDALVAIAGALVAIV